MALYLDYLLDDVGQTDVTKHAVEHSSNHCIVHWV